MRGGVIFDENRSKNLAQKVDKTQKIRHNTLIMSEPRRLQSVVNRNERPKPKTIRPQQAEPFPPAAPELKTEREKKSREWKRISEYVSNKVEADHIAQGLDTIARMEAGEPVTPEEMKRSKQAQKIVAEFQKRYPRKEISTVVEDIRVQMNTMLGVDASTMATEGIELPTGEKFNAIQDYLETISSTQPLLDGLEQSYADDQTPTPARALALQFMAREGVKTPEEGILRVRQILRQKKDTLQRLGIEM